MRDRQMMNSAARDDRGTPRGRFAFAPALTVSLVAGAAAAGSGPVPPGDVALAPVRDTTIYNAAEPTANGAGPVIFAGRTGGGGGAVRQRALLDFDVASAIPAGAVVTEVRLVLELETGSGPGDRLLSLHRLGSDWGEGASVAPGGGGAGAPAEPGDATWDHRFFPRQFWTSPGADFAPASATLAVDAVPGPRIWSGPGLVADVQAMLDDPAADHGWALVGDESTASTSRRFASRESADPAVHPRLEVTFVTALPCEADINDNGAVDLPDLLAVLGNWGPCPGCPADLNLDDVVDLSDLLAVLATWGPCP